MQGTMDIVAMMQKSSSIKPGKASSSFGKNTERTSFKNELAEARKITAHGKSNSQPEKIKIQETLKYKKAEKMAKVMSGNKITAEKAEGSTEKVEDSTEKLTTRETAEDKTVTGNMKLTEAKETDAAKVDAQTYDNMVEAEQSPEFEMAEAIQSMQALMQQLTQLINGTEASETTPENLKQIEATVQAVSEKLDQMLLNTEDTKAAGTDIVLKDLKVELKELIKQLKNEVKEVETSTVEKPSLQQAVSTMKQLINKMNEVKPMLQQKLNEQEAISELPEQKLELLVKQIKSSNDTDNSTAEIKSSDEGTMLKAAPESNAMESTDKEKDNKENNKEANHKEFAKETPKHTAAMGKHGFEINKNTNDGQIQKPDAQFNFREISLNNKKEPTVVINKSDIVNQVIKKADIIVREGHSEMVMKLEPESLGKLNLKLVVERGIVTAKFVAESQQVKEVIESSFNQLKDALQEKGIAVQNFSVSVGQQASDSRSNQSFNQWKQSIKIKNKSAGEFMGIDDEAIANQNPYNYHEGKFDYRA